MSSSQIWSQVYLFTWSHTTNSKQSQNCSSPLLHRASNTTTEIRESRKSTANVATNSYNINQNQNIWTLFSKKTHIWNKQVNWSFLMFSQVVFMHTKSKGYISLFSSCTWSCSHTLCIWSDRGLWFRSRCDILQVTRENMVLCGQVQFEQSRAAGNTPSHSFSADVNDRESLDLCSYWVSRVLVTFIHLAHASEFKEVWPNI